MLLAMTCLKCLLCIIVFIYVDGTSIGIMLLQDMYLNYQQANNWLDDWINHLLHNRLGQYSIVLCSVVKDLCSLFSKCCVVYMKWNPYFHCLLASVYVWYYIRRKCKRLVQHLSVGLAKSCVPVCYNVHCTMLQEIQDKSISEYSKLYALYLAYIAILVESTVRRLGGCRWVCMHIILCVLI